MAGGENQKAVSGEDSKGAQGGYNWKAVAPFLGKESKLYGITSIFHGRAVNKDALSDEDKNYFYHVTTMGNLESILDTGLDPDRGGIGGAGTLIHGEKDAQEADRDDASNAAQQGFNQKSRGYLHASEFPEIVVPYAYEYDMLSDDNPEEVKNIPVILRFKKDALKPSNYFSALLSSICHFSLDPLRGYQSDPYQYKAIRTESEVKWYNLEILTERGWTPLDAELENGHRARDEIRAAI